MSSDEPTSRAKQRAVIPVTCEVHQGTPGFTNLVMRKLDDGIELDPHADQCCVLHLSEESATALFDQLGAWLS